MTVFGHLQCDHCDAEDMDYGDLPTVNLDHGMTNKNNEGGLIFCHLVLLILFNALSACSFHMLELKYSLPSDRKPPSFFSSLSLLLYCCFLFLGSCSSLFVSICPVSMTAEQWGRYLQELQKVQSRLSLSPLTI